MPATSDRRHSGKEWQLLIHDNIQPPKQTHSAPSSCSKRIALKLMKTEQRHILLGISLTGIAVKLRVFIVCEMPAFSLTSVFCRFESCLHAATCCLIPSLTLWFWSKIYLTFSEANMLNVTAVCFQCGACFSCLAIIFSPAEPPA